MTNRTADMAMQVCNLFGAKTAGWPSKYASDGRPAGRLTRLGDAVLYHVQARGRVLYLGCDTGELAFAIAAYGMQETGCDISPEALHRAEARKLPSEAVDWIALDPDWQVLPFGPEGFDAVVASSVLEYVNQLVAVLRKCRPVLRPGGIERQGTVAPGPGRPILRASR
jgi:SAM-dependent methyltransferase